jgi:uncharacterized membrane protein
MPMLVHELHPTLIHLPLTMLPAAAAVDLLAAGRRDRSLSRLGRSLWMAGAGGGLLAGLAGMAASQEVKIEEQHVRDTMWLHGMGNVAVVAAALGVALWRRTHPASLATGLGGLAATGVAIYSAYLGGELVYEHGVGTSAMGPEQRQGVATGTPLFSSRAPRTLARDAIAGLRWLLGTSQRKALGRERFEPAALGASTPGQPPEATRH